MSRDQLLSQLLFYGGLACLVASFIPSWTPQASMTMRTASMLMMLAGLGWMLALGRKKEA